MSRTLPLFVAALCAAVLLPIGSALCPAGEPLPAEQRIEQVLDSEAKGLDFPVPTALSEVARTIEDNHGIGVQIDIKALEDAGMTSDVEIRNELKGISLRSALRLLLREQTLTYLVRDEVLLITTREEADVLLTTKVYPVADLVAGVEASHEFPNRCGRLISVITTTVKPESWQTGGGPGSVAAMPLPGGEVLVVSQTYHGHREIAGLLDALRGVAGSDRRTARRTTQPPPPRPSGGDPFAEPAGKEPKPKKSAPADPFREQ